MSEQAFYSSFLVVLSLFALGIAVSVWMYLKKKSLALSDKLSIKAVMERRSKEMDILAYEVTMPPAVGGATKYTLIIERDETAGGDLTAYERKELAAGETTTMIEVAQDTKAKLTVSAVDEAGNASEPVSVEFVAVDTIAPTLEGNIGIKAVGERNSIPAAPAPVEPEAPVAPAPEVVDAPVVTDGPAIPEVSDAPVDVTPPSDPTPA